jgi:hypothetical protein
MAQPLSPTPEQTHALPAPHSSSEAHEYAQSHEVMRPVSSRLCTEIHRPCGPAVHSESAMQLSVDSVPRQLAASMVESHVRAITRWTEPSGHLENPDGVPSPSMTRVAPVQTGSKGSLPPAPPVPLTDDDIEVDAVVALAEVAAAPPADDEDVVVSPGSGTSWHAEPPIPAAVSNARRREVSGAEGDGGT